MFSKLIKNIFSSFQCHICFTQITVDNILCLSCEKNIIYLPPSYITIGKHVLPIFCLGSYNGVLKEIIHSKYTKNPILFHYVGLKIASEIERLSLKIDYIISVPMHPLKKSIRWFNQSNECAKTISSKLHIKQLFNIKIALKKDQSSLESYEKRIENVKDIFHIQNPYDFFGKKILIIDDVYTSGATIRSLAKEILKNKPLSIMIFTIARKI